MGVTIHFEGKLKSDTEFAAVVAKAVKFAMDNSMDYTMIDEQSMFFSRVKDEQDWDYESSAKGILIVPEENCEPLIFEFDANNYMQDYCKTQFADLSIHIGIVGLLKEIEPHFSELTVTDEGEYWDEPNAARLEELINDCFKVIDEMKQENDKLEGPFKMEDGRIIDLMEP